MIIKITQYYGYWTLFYQIEQMISPPIPSFLACLSVITPFDVERIFIPYPFKIRGILSPLL
jgi:hypothetical protein